MARSSTNHSSAGRLIIAVATHKNHNIGPVLRNAAAFGAEFVAIVGSSAYSTHGAKGSQTKVVVRHFFTWIEFTEALEHINITTTHTYGISPCKVEIVNNSERMLSSSVSTTDRVIENNISGEFSVPYSSVSLCDVLFNECGDCSKNEVITSDISSQDASNGVSNVSLFVIGEKNEFSSDLFDICNTTIHVDLPSVSGPKISAGNIDCLAYECIVGIVLQKFKSSFLHSSRTSFQSIATDTADTGKYYVNRQVHCKSFIKSSSTINRNKSTTCMKTLHASTPDVHCIDENDCGDDGSQSVIEGMEATIDGNSALESKVNKSNSVFGSFALMFENSY